MSNLHAGPDGRRVLRTVSRGALLLPAAEEPRNANAAADGLARRQQAVHAQIGQAGLVPAGTRPGHTGRAGFVAVQQVRSEWLVGADRVVDRGSVPVLLSLIDALGGRPSASRFRSVGRRPFCATAHAQVDAEQAGGRAQEEVTWCAAERSTSRC